MREHGQTTHSSFFRRVVCDASTPDDIRTRLERGEADELLVEGKRLQSKPRCEVARLEHPAGPMLFKRHTWGDAGRTLRMAFRAPVARQCFRHAQWLRDRRVPTPRPLALVEDRVGPLGLRSYLLTEFIEGESLFDLIRWGAPTLGRCEHLARQVATLWQRLIDLEVAHCDLKPENFIVDRRDRVWLIDLEKLRVSPPRDRFVRQHMVDVESFLHVRAWRHRLEAAEIFRKALAATSLGNWAQQCGQSTHPVITPGYAPEELNLRVRVIILAEPTTTAEHVKATQESVRVLTDDVLVTDELPAVPCSDSEFWFLLRPGERISADLARHLVESLLREPRVAAIRVPLLGCDFSGRRRPVADPVITTGCRVFHPGRTSPRLHTEGGVRSPRLHLGELAGPTLPLQDAIEVPSPAASLSSAA